MKKKLDDMTLQQQLDEARCFFVQQSTRASDTCNILVAVLLLCGVLTSSKATVAICLIFFTVAIMTYFAATVEYRKRADKLKQMAYADPDHGSFCTKVSQITYCVFVIKVGLAISAVLSFVFLLF